MEKIKKIKKRDGSVVDFEAKKIETAMDKAFHSVGESVSAEELTALTDAVTELIWQRFGAEGVPGVEEVQDLVELTLIDRKYYSTVKAFILYRSAHNDKRRKIDGFKAYIQDPDTLALIKGIAKEFSAEEYDLKYLLAKLESFAKKEMTEEDYLKALIRGAAKLTAKEAPDWEFIAGRFLRLGLQNEIDQEKCSACRKKSKNGNKWDCTALISGRITAMMKSASWKAIWYRKEMSYLPIRHWIC